MQERDGGSKGLGSGKADSSKQRAGCFLGEDQITDSGFAASSSSHRGRKQSGVNRAKLDRTFKISINSAENASCSISET